MRCNKKKCLAEQVRRFRARFVQSVAVVSLSAGAVLEWAIDACEGKKTGETALLWRLIPRLERGDVVIADGYYAGYFMIATLIALGVDIVRPQHHLRITDFRRGQHLGTRDHGHMGSASAPPLDG